MRVLKDLFPEYRSLNIHESSPSGSTFSRFKKECSRYSFSYYYPDWPLGKTIMEKATNQNLEELTFKDNTFDIFITQDVMEHVVRPTQAFSEIARVLKQGGVYIFTTPLYRFVKTQARIKVDGADVIETLPAIYHGNPIDAKGSLVTYDWGYDIADIIKVSCGMETEIIEFKNSKGNHRQGLEADFLEIIVCRKK